MRQYVCFISTCGVVSIRCCRYPEAAARLLQQRTRAVVHLRGMIRGTPNDCRRIQYLLRHRCVRGPWFEMTTHVQSFIRQILRQKYVPRDLTAFYMHFKPTERHPNGKAQKRG